MARQGIAALLHNELRHGYRDRSMVILAIVMPLLLAAITSLAFGAMDHSKVARVAIVNAAGKAGTRDLGRQLKGDLERAATPALVDVIAMRTEAAARRAVKQSYIDAAIILSQRSSGTTEPTLLVNGSEKTIGAQIARGALEDIAAQMRVDALAVELATSGRRPAARTSELIASATTAPSVTGIQDVRAANGTVDALSYFAPSMVVLGLFFCGQMLTRGLAEERESRTLARLLVAGISARSILLSKAIAAFIVGALSATVVLGTFALAGAQFGAILWLVPLVSLVVVAMISVAALVGLVATNSEQGSAVGLVVAFVLAILGGNFVPLSQTNGALRTISLLTPNGWAVRAFADLSVVATHPWDVVRPALIALGVFTAITGIPAAMLASRAVRTTSAW